LILIFGTDGVGKTTFAAGAPNPIFIEIERGTAQLDVSRYPRPKHWTEFNSFLDELLNDEHDYKTVVIDSLDWLEAMLHRHICSEYNVKTIERAGGGYGKGYTVAVEKFRELNEKLDEIRTKRGMNIVLICHSDPVTFNDPQEQEAYQRYELKLHKKSSAVYREYVDALLFANFETLIKEEDNGRTKALSDGTRLLFTERRAGFDAKNRYGLPFQLDLSWKAFDDAAKIGQPDSADEIKKRLMQMHGTIEDKELKYKVLDAIEKAGSDAQKLIEIENRLRVKLKTLKEGTQQ
jgi:hypothetical protein